MAALGRLRRRFVRGERGAAMVEFAVATPLLLLLAFGVIDFGRAFYVYNKLSSTVRDAARYGAAQGAGPTGTMTTAQLQTRVTGRISSVILGEYGLTGSAAPASAHVVVTIQNYQFNAWLPILPMSRNIVITTSASFRREL
jgi:Flp pilus assembly protein TadG